MQINTLCAEIEEMFGPQPTAVGAIRQAVVVDEDGRRFEIVDIVRLVSGDMGIVVRPAGTSS